MRSPNSDDDDLEIPEISDFSGGVVGKYFARYQEDGSVVVDPVMEQSVKYVVVFERGPKSWSAYVPDLPGCIAAGKSRAEVRRLIREAIRMHIDGMREDGEPIPEPGNTTEVVEV